MCEICELAKINRMTFYNHYNDKYALFIDALSDIKNTVLYRYKRETVILDLRKKSDCILHLFKIICEVSYEYRKITKSVSSSQHFSHLFKIITDLFTSSPITIIDNPENSTSFEYEKAFIIGGITALLQYYVINYPNNLDVNAFFNYVKSLIEIKIK